MAKSNDYVRPVVARRLLALSCAQTLDIKKVALKWTKAKLSKLLLSCPPRSAIVVEDGPDFFRRLVREECGRNIVTLFEYSPDGYRYRDGKRERVWKSDGLKRVCYRSNGHPVGDYVHAAIIQAMKDAVAAGWWAEAHSFRAPWSQADVAENLAIVAKAAGLPGHEHLAPGTHKLPTIGYPAVYFVRNGDGAIKIGFSSTLQSRLKTMQTDNASRLEVIETCPGTVALEKELHRRFSHLRLTGEWFRPGEDLLRFITFLKQVKSRRPLTAQDAIQYRHHAA